MSDVVISAKNLSKIYNTFQHPWERIWDLFNLLRMKNKKEIKALDNINLKINRGEVVAIIGLNGSGKTTLLEILTGTLSASTGSVKVNGRVSALLELGSGFNPEYTGRDNVVLNGLLLGLSKREIFERFGEIEEFAEIGEAINHPVRTYSSGMVMRLAFAVQVLCKPDIVIIDEALSVGDFFFQQKCFKYIRGLSKKGVTLLFVSHDMSTVRDLSQRAILMNKGKISFDGDAIQALQMFLSSDQENLSLNSKQNESNKNDHRSNEHTDLLRNPMWKINLEEQHKFKARILEVGIYSNNNEAATSFKIGDKLNLRVNYEVFCDAPVHIGFIIKNRYDQIVNSTSSYNLRLKLPNEKSGALIEFSADVVLNLEAGNYSISVNLGLETEKVNRGENLYETPWLGPIEVKWDYNIDVAPFFGMAALPVDAHFKKKKLMPRVAL